MTVKDKPSTQKSGQITITRQPATKTIMDKANTGRRPYRSESGPKIGLSKPAKPLSATRGARVTTDTPNPRAIAGING